MQELDVPNTFVYLCGGLGKRFQSMCPQRKPCQLIFHRPMYQWVLESMFSNTTQHIPLMLVIHNDDNGKSILYNVQKEYKNKCVIDHVKINYNTRGPIETCQLFFKQKQPRGGVWIVDNDILYDSNIPWNMSMESGALYILVQEMSAGEKILYSAGAASPYSHVIINETGYIEQIKEKVNISDYIVLGAYGFGSSVVFEKVCQKFLNDDAMTSGEWFLSCLVQKAIDNNIPVKAVISRDTIAIGTPEQVQTAIRQARIIPKPLRWVFDLDQTLVSLPAHPGDYSTVEPYYDKIKFVQDLYAQGHYIIIHTARHMVSCNGDVAAVEQKVGLVTRSVLAKFSIPYHELIFGKPYADVYVDDKATNPIHWDNEWLTASMGFGWNTMLQGKYVNTKIRLLNDTTCVKLCNYQEAKGLIYYVNNCPKFLLDYIPKIISVDNLDDVNPTKEPIRITMEWKNDAIPIGKLLAADTLTIDIFQQVFSLMKNIHSLGGQPNSLIYELIQQNYYPKFIKRYSEFPIYEHFKVNLAVIYEFFKSYTPLVSDCIHGDFWLSNLLWSHKEKKIYMIDMRGALGNIFTVMGDKRYDYAKLYQSIIGFDKWILTGERLDHSVRSKWESFYIEQLRISDDELQLIRKITCFLILGSLPFHEELWQILPEIHNELAQLWPGIFEMS